MEFNGIAIEPDQFKKRRRSSWRNRRRSNEKSERLSPNRSLIEFCSGNQSQFAQPAAAHLRQLKLPVIRKKTGATSTRK